MRQPHRLFVAALSLLAGAAFDRPAAGQHQRPAIADPAWAYLVEGRVLRADGRPAVGVVVERAATADGAAPYSAGAYRAVTSATGGFRFHFSGLGMTTGSTWYLAVRRPGCPGAVSTVQLELGRVPPYGVEGDVRTGVVVRLPACATDRLPPRSLPALVAALEG